MAMQVRCAATPILAQQALSLTVCKTVAVAAGFQQRTLTKDPWRGETTGAMVVSRTASIIKANPSSLLRGPDPMA